MKNAILAASLPFVLAACTIIPAGSAGPASPASPESPASPLVPATPSEPAPNSSLAWAALGQRVAVDGPQVTPLELLEDSRCPANVTCVWAGQVRIRTVVHVGTSDSVRELISGKPEQVADGTLELVEIRPVKTSEAAIAPDDYRFGFRFIGGL